MVEIPTMEDQLSDTSSEGSLASGDEQSGPAPDMHIDRLLASISSHS